VVPIDSLSYCSLDLGTCRFGFGFGGTGKKSNNKQFDDYGGPFGKADVIGCHLDLESLGKEKCPVKGSLKGQSGEINN
jgi:hypothetical protein